MANQKSASLAFTPVVIPTDEAGTDENDDTLYGDVAYSKALNPGVEMLQRMLESIMGGQPIHEDDYTRLSCLLEELQPKLDMVQTVQAIYTLNRQTQVGRLIALAERRVFEEINAIPTEDLPKLLSALYKEMDTIQARIEGHARSPLTTAPERIAAVAQTPLAAGQSAATQTSKLNHGQRQRLLAMMEALKSAPPVIVDAEIQDAGEESSSA